MKRERRWLLPVALLLTALLLAGCRFVVVETGSVWIETPTRQPLETQN